MDLIDIDVKRNAYGRQVDSFIASQLTWTQFGHKFLKVINKQGEQNSICEAVFIRAPRIIRTGPAVEVLLNTIRPNTGSTRKHIGSDFPPGVKRTGNGGTSRFSSSVFCRKDSNLF